jgi:hypothetical protein
VKKVEIDRLTSCRQTVSLISRRQAKMLKFAPELGNLFHFMAPAPPPAKAGWSNLAATGT